MSQISQQGPAGPQTTHMIRVERDYENHLHEHAEHFRDLGIITDVSVA
jgi:hypothetical protein